MSFARRTDTHQRCAHLDLAALEELCVLTHRFSLSFVRSQVVVSRPNQIKRWRPAPSMMAPTHPQLARASLDPSKYPTINAFLKSLKRHARTLSPLFAQHATELAVLERLYYLNNNQHRPALFWQRVAEARRYSRRLRSLDVPLLVDGLRRAFYGDVTDARWVRFYFFGCLTNHESRAPCPAKLEPAKERSVVPLSARAHSQIFPRASVYL